MKKFLIVAGAITLSFLVIIGACTAFVGGVANEVSKEDANDKPTTVTEGAAFTHDGYQVAKGWKVAREQYVGATITGLRVTNTKETSGSGDTVMLTFRFYKGKNVLGEVECTSKELQQGESSAMDCFSLDEGFPKGYQKIRVSDMW